MLESISEFQQLFRRERFLQNGGQRAVRKHYNKMMWWLGECVRASGETSQRGRLICAQAAIQAAFNEGDWPPIEKEFVAGTIEESWRRLERWGCSEEGANGMKKGKSPSRLVGGKVERLHIDHIIGKSLVRKNSRQNEPGVLINQVMHCHPINLVYSPESKNIRKQAKIANRQVRVAEACLACRLMSDRDYEYLQEAVGGGSGANARAKLGLLPLKSRKFGPWDSISKLGLSAQVQEHKIGGSGGGGGALNVDHLYDGLMRYKRCLQSHSREQEEKFRSLDAQFSALFDVYDGHNATELRENWGRTTQWIDLHLDTVDKLAGLLGKRTNHLRLI